MTSAIPTSDNWHIVEQLRGVKCLLPPTAYYCPLGGSFSCDGMLSFSVDGSNCRSNPAVGDGAGCKGSTEHAAPPAGYRPADGTAGRCLPRMTQRRPCTWAEHSIYIYIATPARCSQTSALRGAVSYCCG